MSGDRLDALDYYDLLRIDPDASADSVRDAFHAFARRYHPDRFAGEPDEKRERAAEIYRRGAEGYRVLLDPIERKAYDAGLARGERRLDRTKLERHTSRPPGVLAARTVKGRPFFQKAQDALRAGNLQVARLNLKLLLGYEPDNEPAADKLREIEAKLTPR